MIAALVRGLETDKPEHGRRIVELIGVFDDAVEFDARLGTPGLHAVGRAVRASIVTVNVLDFFLSLALWGTSTTVQVSG